MVYGAAHDNVVYGPSFCYMLDVRSIVGGDFSMDIFNSIIISREKA